MFGGGAGYNTPYPEPEHTPDRATLLSCREASHGAVERLVNDSCNWLSLHCYPHQHRHIFMETCQQANNKISAYIYLGGSFRPYYEYIPSLKLDYKSIYPDVIQGVFSYVVAVLQLAFCS